MTDGPADGSPTPFDGAESTKITLDGDGSKPNGEDKSTALDPSTFDDKELGEWVTKKGVKTQAALAKMARDTEKAYHSRDGAFELPSTDASPEDMSAFYAKIGRPESADGYSFENMPEGLDENFPYNADDAATFKGWAHEAGLRPEQAQLLHDKFVKQQNDLFVEGGKQSKEQTDQQAADQAKAARDATKVLEKEFDAPSGSPTFNSNLEYAKRFFRENGDEDLRKEMASVGALKEAADGSTHIMAPKLFAAIAKAGKALYAEGGRHFGDGKADANPWDKKTWNVTQQHQIVKHDPERAAKLKQRAGVT